jgi:hypothetical protein
LYAPAALSNENFPPAFRHLPMSLSAPPWGRVFPCESPASLSNTFPTAQAAIMPTTTAPGFSAVPGPPGGVPPTDPGPAPAPQSLAAILEVGSFDMVFLYILSFVLIKWQELL